MCWNRLQKTFPENTNNKVDETREHFMLYLFQMNIQWQI